VRDDPTCVWVERTSRLTEVEEALRAALGLSWFSFSQALHSLRDTEVPCGHDASA